MGGYCKIKYEDHLVIKSIEPKRTIEREFLERLMGDNDIKSLLNDYLNDLNSIGVKVAKVIDIKDSMIYQEFISGQTMIEFLRYTNVFKNNWNLLMEKVNEIALLILRTKEEGFRIDTNLDNFILNKDELILVDYFPPIYIQKFEEIKGGEFDYLKPLFIDIKVQYIAFMGYVLANLTRNEHFLLDEKENKVKLKSCLELLENHLGQIEGDSESKTEIGKSLTKRLNCFLLYFDNRYSYEKLQSEIKKYSVTKALDKYNNK